MNDMYSIISKKQQVNDKGTMTMLDQFVKGYVACALWSSTDDQENPIDANYSVENIAHEAMATMVEDCTKFYAENLETLKNYVKDVTEGDGEPWATAGHDFFLTRNGAGTGFWDRDGVREETGEVLTEQSELAGPCYLYVGDDKMIYAM